jgi:hypothetical protein
MLVAGVLLWLTVGRGWENWNEHLIVVIAPLAALALLAIPRVRRVGQELLSQIETPPPRRRAQVALAIAVSATAYFLLTAFLQGRYFGPLWHDEHSYLTQAHMFARGRLWMPPHELAEFFDSFYILHHPVYASMYFPGTALLYVPTVWLGLPSWVMPVLAAGSVVGLVYRVVTELVDGVSGILAALLLVCIQSFRLMSLLFMSQVPLMLFGLLMVWAYLRWRARRRPGWILAIGLFAGWAALTRPVDAICFALPVGLAVLADVFRVDTGQKRVSPLWATALLLAGAAPLLVLQALINRGATGNWTTTPWTLYVQRDFPQTQMGFRAFDASRRPISTSPHKQHFYDRHVLDLVHGHNAANLHRVWLRHRLPTTLSGALPHPGLVVVLPAGVLACVSRRRWVLAAALPVFVSLYIPSIFFTAYYPVVIAPAAALLVVLGVHVLADALPRWRGGVRLLLVLSIAGIALSKLPEAERGARDHPFEPRLTRALERALAEQVQAPAIILIRYSPDRDLNEQSVANFHSAWPDDAAIIRAHDLREKNQVLFRYYAARQPLRKVYRFDESDGSIQELGRVSELADGP